MRSLLATLTAVIGLASVSLAQQATPPTLSLELPQGKQSAKAKVNARLKISFAPGLHAYENPPTDPSLVPLTVVGSNADTKIVTVTYPRGDRKPFPGYPAPLGVYEGTISIPITLELPDKEGEIRIEVESRFQLCNDSTCWPPSSGKASGTLSLTKAGIVASQTTRPPTNAGANSGTSSNPARGPVSIRSFVSASSTLSAGGQLAVSWITENAARVEIGDGSQNLPVDTGGSQAFTILRDTVLTLSAYGADGQVSTRTLEIKVTPVKPETGAGTVTPPVETPSSTPISASAGTTPSVGAPATDQTARDIEAARSSGLPQYLLLAFLAGLAALATPCVWPMIPITVSYFSKRGTEKKRDTRGALAYSLGIMSTFTLLGVLVSVIFGATGIQRLAANPWVNASLAIVFIVLALSLFGVLDFVLPQGVVSKFQSGTQKQGLLGPILMGVTFTLTSFTCTVPFVGTLLVSATKGDVAYPALGMLAFSTAFAVPFMLLALFPQWLAGLPKSGAWLATSKAYMGFLEIAAALKFISNVDVVNRWGLITQPVFLALWTFIFGIAGLWLAGAIRLPHDTPGKISWGRRVFGLANVAIAGYLLLAINGAPLGSLGGFLPPNPYPGRETEAAKGEIAWVHSYEEAVALSKSTGKPLFLNFTGDTCVNCRVMESTVFPTAEVRPLIDQTVAVWLVTDREDAESKANSDLRLRLTNSVTNPVYVVLKPDGTVAATLGGSTQGPAPFRDWLQSAIKASS